MAGVGGPELTRGVRVTLASCGATGARRFGRAGVGAYRVGADRSAVFWGSGGAVVVGSAFSVMGCGGGCGVERAVGSGKWYYLERYVPRACA